MVYKIKKANKVEKGHLKLFPLNFYCQPRDNRTLNHSISNCLWDVFVYNMILFALLQNYIVNKQCKIIVFMESYLQNIDAHVQYRPLPPTLNYPLSPAQFLAQSRINFHNQLSRVMYALVSPALLDLIREGNSDAAASVTSGVAR